MKVFTKRTTKQLCTQNCLEFKKDASRIRDRFVLCIIVEIKELTHNDDPD